MYTVKKKVNRTYFIKEKEIKIDDSIGKVVLLEVNSPLTYGTRTIKFYGKVIKVTKCYFYILTYFQALVDEWNTEQIKIIEKENKLKKWSKKSVQKLYQVRTDERIVEVKYTNPKD